MGVKIQSASKERVVAEMMVRDDLCSVPAVHRGRRTMVWQTRITAENGKLLALVTQTQMVLEPRP